MWLCGLWTGACVCVDAGARMSTARSSIYFLYLHFKHPHFSWYGKQIIIKTKRIDTAKKHLPLQLQITIQIHLITGANYNLNTHNLINRHGNGFGWSIHQNGSNMQCDMAILHCMLFTIIIRMKSNVIEECLGSGQLYTKPNRRCIRSIVISWTDDTLIIINLIVLLF